MAFDFSGYDFNDATQRQKANDQLKGFVSSNNPGGYNADAILRGFSGYQSGGRYDDPTFKQTLWNAVNPGQASWENGGFTDAYNSFDVTPYKGTYDAWKNYNAGNMAATNSAIATVENQKKTMPVAQGGYMQPPAPATNMGFSAAPAGGSPIGTGQPVNNAYTPTMNGNKAVAPSNFTQQDYQAVARMGGYTGDMGGGAHQAWIDADPTGQRQQQWNQALSNYMQQQGNAAGQVAGGGVKAVGVVEPLNDWQKTALEKLNAGAPDTGYSGNAAAALSAANLGLSNPQNAMNPYIDYITEELNRQFDKNANAARDRAARTGNSGSSSEAIRLSENDKNRLSVLGQLLSGNWNNAQSDARANAAANINLANAYAGLDTHDIQKYYDAAKTALGAGGVAQENNQLQLNATQAELQRQRAYEQQQLQFLMQILGAYPSGNAISTTQPGNAIGGALGGGLLGNYIGTSGLLGGSSTPANAANYSGNDFLSSFF